MGCVAWFARDFYSRRLQAVSTLADFVSVSVRLSERNQRNSSLRQLSSDLIRVQDEERRKIARELHDSAGQYLAAVNMNLSRLSKHVHGPGADVLADTQKLVDQCLSETRTISHLLHPPLLNEAGLRSATEWYTEGFSQRSGIEVSLKIDEKLGRLPDESETALFRFLQEALVNVHRHSGSKKVDIEIGSDSGAVLVRVRDYGKGLTFSELREINRGLSRGVGLTGLRERIQSLGGSFEVAIAQPGVLIEVILPCELPSRSRP